jgi:hypothetical protein
MSNLKVNAKVKDRLERLERQVKVEYNGGFRRLFRLALGQLSDEDLTMVETFVQRGGKLPAETEQEAMALERLAVAWGVAKQSTVSPPRKTH